MARFSPAGGSRRGIPVLALLLLLLLAAPTGIAQHAMHQPLAGEQMQRVQSGCNFFGNAGTDYADANLSVVQLNSTKPLSSCCAACDAWNNAASRKPAAAHCSIGVVLRGDVCVLKPSSTQPFHAAHATAVRPEQGPGAMANLELIVLPLSVADRYGAKCLDGSPPALYYKAANTSADPSAANKWALFFKGGGWCYNEASCYSRSKMLLGSSTQLNATQPKFGYGGSGPVGDDPVVNPSFAHFNRVILWYCDGGSFTGDRTEPIVVNRSNVWFRGKRNLDAMLGYLRNEHGLGSATEVLVSGGSAGGLSAYIHADYIHASFPSPSAVQKFRAAPVSGFFLNHRTMNGALEHEANMRYVYTMMNSSAGVNRACAAHYAPQGDGEAWRCIFANESWTFSATPTFALQSAIDAYQISDILDFPNKQCAGLHVGNPQAPGPQMSNCSVSELATLAQYERDFMTDVQSSPAFRRAGSGGFIESCVEHCLGMAGGWNVVTQNNVTMQQAMSAWWDAPDGAPAEGHWHLPCDVRSSSPGQCNPSCTVKSDDEATAVRTSSNYSVLLRHGSQADCPCFRIPCLVTTKDEPDGATLMLLVGARWDSSECSPIPASGIKPPRLPPSPSALALVSSTDAVRLRILLSARCATCLLLQV